MGLVDDVNLEAVAGRTVAEVLDDGAGVVDFAIRGAVDLDHVQGAALADLDAGRAFAARLRGGTLLTVKASRQDARGGGLADPADAGEQEGVCNPPAGNRLRQRARYVLLPDPIGEAVPAPFALQHPI